MIDDWPLLFLPCNLTHTHTLDMNLSSQPRAHPSAQLGPRVGIPSGSVGSRLRRSALSVAEDAAGTLALRLMK